MATQSKILLEAERLEKSISEHDRRIHSLQTRRKHVKKQLRNPLLGLLLAVVIAALLTSSCTIHAGELMGRWDAEEVVGAWEGLLEGYLEQAEALGTVPYVIASVILAAINLPVALPTMLIAPLRMIAMALEMNFPVAVPYLAYVELAIVLLVFLVVLQEIRPFGRNREPKKELRGIDDDLQRHKSQRQQESARLRELKGSREYAEALERQERIDETNAILKKHGLSLEDILREQKLASVPEGFSLSQLDRYFNENAGKATLVMQFLLPRVKTSAEASSSVEGSLTSKEYLAEFDRCFHSMSRQELYAKLGISKEMVAAFGVDWDD